MAQNYLQMDKGLQRRQQDRWKLLKASILM
jgi:hypothetical protein